MSRIRSVHPGLFTDEAFVSLSSDAQILFIGLWTEADDQGVFEWKPLTLRMRLRPTKDGPIEPLLSELTAANCVKLYEIDGRKLGAIRNFRKFQRPKSPNAIHVINDDIRIYVGLSLPISEMKPLQPPPVPRKAEKSPQMEDGGKEKGYSDPNGSAPSGPLPDPVKALFDVGVQLLTASGRKDGDARSLVGKWRKSLGDEELMGLISQAARKTEPVAWLTAAVSQAAERRRKPYGEAML